MPNTLTSIFVSNPATEPVEAPHPNTGVYVTGTQATAGGPWTVVHTLITKTTTPLTMVGRLKNFPTVTVSVVASGGPNTGNIFNNVLATPTGLAATGTSSGTINVAVNSISNQTGYRLLAADASTGPFTQLYQGTTASYPHTGLAASQTKYYEWQYVGGGFYDDSALSAVFSGATTAAAAVVEYVIPDAAWQSSTQGLAYLNGKLRNTFAYVEFDTTATQMDLNGITGTGVIGYANTASFGVFVGTPANIGTPATFSQNALIGALANDAPLATWIPVTGVGAVGTKRVRVMVPCQVRNGMNTENIIGTVLLSIRANAAPTFVTSFPTSTADYLVLEDSIASSNPANIWTDSWPLRMRQRIGSTGRVVVNSIAGASLVEIYGDGTHGTPDKIGLRALFASSAAKTVFLPIMGANDAGRINVAPADFGTAYTNLVVDMNVQYPAMTMFPVTPFTVTSFESTLSALRTAMNPLPVGRGYLTLVAGPPAFVGNPGPPDPGYAADGVHPNKVQHASIENYLWGSINNLDPNLFSDTFPGTSLNQRWAGGIPGSNPGAATYAVVNNELDITAVVGAGQQTGVISALPFNLSTYRFSCQIKTLFVVRPEAVQYLGFYPDGQGAQQGYQFSITNGTLNFVGISYAILASITYNAVAHKYLSFRMNGTQLVPESSPDGVTWINPFNLTSAVTFATTNVRLLIGGGGTTSTDTVNWPAGKSVGTCAFGLAAVTSSAAAVATQPLALYNRLLRTANSSGQLIGTGTFNGWAGLATGAYKAPAANIVGTVLNFPAFARAADATSSLLVGFATSPVAAFAPAAAISATYALYIDNTVYRVYDSSSGSLTQVFTAPFDTASSQFSITIVAGGYEFRRDNVLKYTIATTPANDQYVNATLYSNTSVISAGTLNSSTLVDALPTPTTYFTATNTVRNGTGTTFLANGQGATDNSTSNYNVFKFTATSAYSAVTGELGNAANGIASMNVSINDGSAAGISQVNSPDVNQALGTAGQNQQIWKFPTVAGQPYILVFQKKDATGLPVVFNACITGLTS